MSFVKGYMLHEHKVLLELKRYSYYTVLVNMASMPPVGISF